MSSLNQELEKVGIIWNNVTVLQDKDGVTVARRIAVWYRQLHSLGESLYDEADSFTLENMAWIQEKTGTQAMPAWAQLEAQYEEILSLLHRVKQTLTYNDFYYTNLIVAKDASSALMFDYNLLGKGYAYADVRNVLSSLSKEAGAAFLEAYGTVDPYGTGIG